MTSIYGIICHFWADTQQTEPAMLSKALNSHTVSFKIDGVFVEIIIKVLPINAGPFSFRYGNHNVD